MSSPTVRNKTSVSGIVELHRETIANGTVMVCMTLGVLSKLRDNVFLPAFQRNQLESVWNLKNKKEYINMALKYNDGIGTFIMALNHHTTPNTKDSYYNYSNNEYHYFISIDGHNRGSTIVEFVSNEFSVNGKFFKDYSKDEQTRILNIPIYVNLHTGLMVYEDQIMLFKAVNNGRVLCVSTLAKNDMRNSINTFLHSSGLLKPIEDLVKQIFKYSKNASDKYWIHGFMRYCSVFIVYKTMAPEKIIESVLCKDDNTVVVIAEQLINDVEVSKRNDIIRATIDVLNTFKTVFEYLNCKDYSLFGCLFLNFLLYNLDNESIIDNCELVRQFCFLLTKGAAVPGNTSIWYGRSCQKTLVSDEDKMLTSKDGIVASVNVKYDQNHIKQHITHYNERVVSALKYDCTPDEMCMFAPKNVKNIKSDNSKRRIQLSKKQKETFYANHNIEIDENGKSIGDCIDCGKTNVGVVLGHLFPYADTHCNLRENLIPICSGCNESARADNNSNQITHQNNHNKLADIKIAEYMLEKFPTTFESKVYNKWRNNYNLPEL
jgi:hypothetical protein